jgi:hypothetical protein
VVEAAKPVTHRRRISNAEESDRPGRRAAAARCSGPGASPRTSGSRSRAGSLLDGVIPRQAQAAAN